MSRDIDWNEMDRIMDQLRAKIKEDDSAEPAPRQASPAAAVQEKENPPAVREKKPATRRSAPAARAQQVPTPVPAKAEESASARVRARAEGRPKVIFLDDDELTVPLRKTSPHTEVAAKEPAATGGDQIMQEPSAAREQGPARRRRSSFGAPAGRSTLFSQPTREAQRLEKNEVAPIPTDTAPAPQLRAEDEVCAEETVENLMRDLFGKTDSAADGVVAPDREIKREMAAETRETSGDVPAPAAKTAAREADGQMTLVLPDAQIPRGTPPPRPARTAERISLFADAAQMDLFSMLDEEEPPVRQEQKTPPTAQEEQKRRLESSEEDFHLLLDLDYEEELGNAIGFEKIRDYHELGVNGREVAKRRRRRSSEKCEYETQGQDMGLRKLYAGQKGEHIFRFVFTLAVMMLLFLYERPQWMAAIFRGPLDGVRYPASYVLIGLQLLLLAVFFSRRRVMEGFLRLVRFSPIDYSLCSALLIVTVIYHVALIFIPHEGYPALYLSPVAACLALLALSDLLDWYRESLAFQVVSSRRQKYALIPRVSVGGKQNSAKEKLTEADSGETLWYVRPVGFVRNYFANTEKHVEHNRSLGSQFLFILAIGVALGLYTYAAGGSVEAVLQTAFLAILFCTPASSLVLISLPMFLATCLRLGKKGAIVGELPIEQCGKATTLVMPDNEVFGAMHHERFELIDGCDQARVAVLIRALLDKLQSPLCDSVSVEAPMRLDPAEVLVTEIGDEGVAAQIAAEKTEVLMGSVAYLERHGVRAGLRVQGDFDHLRKKLICVAVDREVVALFLARYRLSDEIGHLLDDLTAVGVRMTVRTRDPGINGELFARLQPDSREPVGVMKPSEREMDIRTDRVDATVLALGSCKEAARTFVTCRRIRRAGFFGRLLQICSVCVGAATCVALTFLRGSLTLSAFWATLYLLFWCGAHALVSYLCLKEKDGKESR